MHKHTLYATLAMLPILAYAPLSAAGPDDQSKSKNAETIKLESPLEVDDQMVMFEIENAMGGSHKLEELLKEGPIVLTFYRGSWCPYCRTELSTIQKKLKKVTETGAQVLAISPEVPNKTADLAKQNKLGFHFGTDKNNELAKQLALAFKLDAKTIKAYKGYGINLKESNDAKVWELPIPATYVIDTDRTIRYAFVDSDYSKRADYDQVLEVLETIADEE